MDNFFVIILVINACISIATLSKEMLTNIRGEREKREYVSKILSLEEKISSKQYETVLRNYCYDIKTKSFNEELFKKQVNSYKIYMTLKYSSDYISKVYKNNDIFCEVKINIRDYFKTIAKYSSVKEKDQRIIPETFYYIEKNTDLMYIYENGYNKFVITNVEDYKKKNRFLLQDERLEEYCKAIMTLPIYEDEKKSKILACYTICFSRPLDEKIKLRKFDYVVETILFQLKREINDYVVLNHDKLCGEKEKGTIINNHFVENIDTASLEFNEN